ncbi:MAG TPA: hypothetical protein VE959_03060 [Bryobacteraceae bacterium]|nr:hypothetical protein [Bryobacteraceae bacterium]
MNLKTLKTLTVALFLLVGLTLFQGVALADVQLTVIGTPTYNSLGGVYTSPYQFQINNGPTITLLACDDFLTEIYFGFSWPATVNTLDSVGAMGPQKFTHATNAVTYPYDKDYTPPSTAPTDPTIQQQYYAAAWLTDQLLNGSVDPASLEGAYYSYAIWQIFDPTAYLGYNGQSLSGAQQDQVSMAMVAAFAAIANPGTDEYLDSTMRIYTPDGVTSQEFIGFSVPEASTVAFLAFNFLALVGIILLMRRRTRRNA